MKIVRSFFLCLGVCATAIRPVFGQEDYNTSKINPTLIDQANAVVRYSEINWDILSKSEARARERKVVTILNEVGEEEHGQLYVRYDKFTKIMDIRGVLYDGTGTPIKKLKNSDIADYGYGAGGDEITDARIKVAGFGKKAYAYPYTIEYSYETRDRNLMSYPGWIPAPDARTAVEQSVFKISTPAGFSLRYKGYNGVAAAEISSDKEGRALYTWKLENRPAISQRDAYPLPLTESSPMVLSAPDDFEVQNYQGNFKSWESLGKFYYTLNTGRDVLPAATQAEITNLVKDAKSDREKILLVYKWIQSRSRYVSIQLGIGGWQTIDAMTVANKGYGDCKGLSNLTIAALRAARVVSYPALIKAGEEARIKSDFPSNQFNHLIVCALAERDTIWLECTSQVTPANFMGTFTGGRPALLVTPEGGKLVTTPGYTYNQNLRNRKTDIKLAQNGDAQMMVQTIYSGISQESRKNLMHRGNADEQKKGIMNQLSLPSLELERFELSNGSGPEPSVVESLSLNVRSGATRSGKRLFVKPNILSRSLEMPPGTERTNDFYLPPTQYEFTDIDTVSYVLPEGFKLESVLPAVEFSSIFGSLESKTVYSENTLLCTRKFILKGGRYPAGDYANWIDFLKKVRRADRAQVVFVEKQD